MLDTDFAGDRDVDLRAVVHDLQLGFDRVPGGLNFNLGDSHESRQALRSRIGVSILIADLGEDKFALDGPARAAGYWQG